jgi:hypothetical protein
MWYDVALLNNLRIYVMKLILYSQSPIRIHGVVIN